jgi:uncharacterized membrane protein
MSSRRLDRYDVASAVVCALLVAATLAVYDGLPARIPTHFNVHGVADGFASRGVGAWIAPGVALASWVLLRGAPRILPTEWRARLEQSPLSIAALLLVALFAAVQWVVLRAAETPDRSNAASLSVVLGGFFAVFGLLMPRLRRNPLIGIRTTWTLTSDENWARTHRFGGACFVAGGLGMAIAGAGGAPVIGFVLLMGGALAPLLYSFLVAHKLDTRS